MAIVRIQTLGIDDALKVVLQRVRDLLDRCQSVSPWSIMPREKR